MTNRHVVDGGITHVRFNHLETGLTVEPVGAVASETWTVHPCGADIAVTPLLNPSLLSQGRKLAEAEMFIGDVGTSFGEGVQPVEGDGIFVIGFPLGLVGDARNHPVVRYGVVARIQDWIRRDQNTFLIDAPAFPGNSGGPVVLKPDTAALKGTRAITHCLLVGVISKQLRSREVAVSERTGAPRVVFEEDAGLAEVVPVEFVRETALQEISGLQSQ